MWVWSAAELTKSMSQATKEARFLEDKSKTAAICPAQGPVKVLATAHSAEVFLRRGAGSDSLPWVPKLATCCTA